MITHGELGIEQFDQRRVRDPQGAINDLLGQTSRQGRAIHDLTNEVSDMRARMSGCVGIPMSVMERVVAEGARVNQVFSYVVLNASPVSVPSEQNGGVGLRAGQMVWRWDDATKRLNAMRTDLQQALDRLKAMKLLDVAERDGAMVVSVANWRGYETA